MKLIPSYTQTRIYQIYSNMPNNHDRKKKWFVTWACKRRNYHELRFSYHASLQRIAEIATPHGHGKIEGQGTEGHHNQDDEHDETDALKNAEFQGPTWQNYAKLESPVLWPTDTSVQSMQPAWNPALTKLLGLEACHETTERDEPPKIWSLLQNFRARRTWTEIHGLVPSPLTSSASVFTSPNAFPSYPRAASWR